MAHTPLKISIDQAQNEVLQAWTDSYSPAAIERAVDALRGKPLWLQISMFIGRLSFRGIYFPQMHRSQWFWLLLSHRRAIYQLLREAVPANRRPAPEPEPASSTLGS